MTLILATLPSKKDDVYCVECSQYTSPHNKNGDACEDCGQPKYHIDDCCPLCLVPKAFHETGFCEKNKEEIQNAIQNNQ